MVDLTDAEINKQLDTVSRFSDKNQRLSFKRKFTRMDELLKRISPIEEEILKLILQKTPIMDDIDKVRSAMVHDCVHPRDYLVHKGTHILCKFCAKEIKLNV